MEEAKLQAQKLIKEGKLTKENAIIALKYLQASRNEGANYTLIQILVAKELLNKEEDGNILELEVIEKKEPNFAITEKLVQNLEEKPPLISNSSKVKEQKRSSPKNIKNEEVFSSKKENFKDEESSKEFIQIKKSMLWPIVCSLLVITLLVVLFTKNSSGKDKKEAPVPLNNSTLPTPSTPYAGQNRYPQTITPPISIKHDQYIRKMVVIQYLNKGSEIMKGTGFVFKSSNKTYVLTILDLSEQSRIILNQLSSEVINQSNLLEINGIAFPGTKQEKNFRFKIPDKQGSNGVFYLEPLENINFLDSFSYSLAPNLGFNQSVALLGFSANQTNSLSNIITSPPQVQGIEAIILQNGNSRIGINSSILYVMAKQYTNNRLMFGYIAINGNNEILGISKSDYNPLIGAGPKTLICMTDPVNSTPIIASRNPSNDTMANTIDSAKSNIEKKPVVNTNPKVLISNIELKPLVKTKKELAGAEVIVNFVPHLKPEEGDTVKLNYSKYHSKEISNSINLSLKGNVATGSISLSERYLNDPSKFYGTKNLSYSLELNVEIIKLDKSVITLNTQTREFYDPNMNEKNNESAEVQFSEMSLPHPVTCTALSEDGENLFFGDEDSGQISIWSVSSNSLQKTILTPNPKYLLSRGDELYIANYSKGTVSVLSKKREWTLTNQFKIPNEFVYYLSAPNEKFFKNEIIVSSGIKEKVEFFLLNIQDNTCVTILNDRDKSILTFSFNGKTILKQFDYGDYIDGVKTIEYSILKQKKKDAFDNFISSHGNQNYLYQVNNNSFWFGDQGVFWGSPLKNIRNEQNGIILPDRNKNLLYSFYNGDLSIMNINSLFPEINKTSYNFKDASDPFASYKKSSRGVARLENSFAITIDQQVKFYFFNTQQKKFYHANLKSPEVNAKSVGSNTAATNKDFSFKNIPLNGAASCMTLTEDGKFLLIGDEQSDKVYVWNVVTQSIVKTIDVMNPVSILCRKNRSYIVNKEEGSLTVISNLPDWKVDYTFKTNDNSIFYISAPGGEYFKHQLIATARDKTYLIDTINSKSSLIRNFRDIISEVSFDGKFVAQERNLISSSEGYSDLFEYNSYIKKDTNTFLLTSNSDSRSNSILYQVKEGAYWVGINGIFWGSTPKLITKSNPGNIFIPDRKKNVYYVIRSEISSFSMLEIEMNQLDNTQKNLKKFSGSLNSQSMLTQYYSPKNHIPYAVTLEDVIYIFLYDVGLSNIIHASCKINDLNDKIDASTNNPDQLASSVKVIEDQPLKRNYFKNESSGNIEIINGPKGLEIASKQSIIWKPSSTDVGTHQVKIRIENKSGEIKFDSFSIEVISKALAEKVNGDLSKIAEIGKHILFPGNFAIYPTNDGKNIFLAQATTLKLLDAEGQLVLKTVETDSDYFKFSEREQYYLALTFDHLDLIDKSTFKVIKKFDFNGYKARDFAAHPSGQVSFITITDESEGRPDSIKVNKVLQLDEVTGKFSILDSVLGQNIRISPDGKYLYTSLCHEFKDGIQIDFNIGYVIPTYGILDVFLQYQFSNQILEHIDINLTPGKFGRDIVISPDGNSVSYIAVGGYAKSNEENKFAIPVYNDNNITKVGLTYNVEGSPISMAYHPHLSLVIGTNGKDLKLFNRKTSQIIKSEISIKPPFNGIIKIWFTKSGENLLVLYKNNLDNLILESVELKLTTDQKRELAQPNVIINPLKIDPFIKTVKLGGNSKNDIAPEKIIPRTELDFLNLPVRMTISAEVIAKRNKQAVVVVKTKAGSGTGFFISKNGYILSCAHILSGSDPVEITYLADEKGELKEFKASAKVISSDGNRDLSLLKIEVPTPVTSLKLETKITEMGGKVYIIGHPGLGDQLLEYTMTEGIISKPSRKIDDLDYIQTSAGINPGNSGGPLFNSEGNVIGVVVLKAKIDAVGFAVPAADIKVYIEKHLK